MSQGEETIAGASEDEPIILPAEVTAHDLRSFLKFSYPQCV